ncbi:hypothetical protein EV662_11320 [Rhodovulum marinum]|uniref:Integrase-like protein n=1 Tax=Rhodovulum marinum TaxID=320662 RepID=A0A4R2PYA2_9RHOB|nr:hypothetical protein EV662_11320 [Rhodovulum marinum]
MRSDQLPLSDAQLSGPARFLLTVLGMDVARRGRPRTIVSDNGTELTNMAVLRWCQETRIDWHYIAPGKRMRDTASLSRSTAVSGTNS